MNRFDPFAADGIQPCEGWALVAVPEDDTEFFTTTGYEAHRGDEVRRLSVSRFQFTPTQARFDWLVQSGFPGCPTGSWSNAEIDAQLAAAAHLRAA